MDKGDVIFLRVNGQLTAVPRSDYAREDLLQGLLEEHPDLLSGEQLRPGDPVRWLFVTREAAVPDGEGAGDRWSLDHLLVDQDAIPTLVEVKRSTLLGPRRPRSESRQPRGYYPGGPTSGALPAPRKGPPNRISARTRAEQRKPPRPICPVRKAFHSALPQRKIKTPMKSIRPIPTP